MAGIVNELYTWQPTVKIGTAALQNARVRVWDNDGDSAINLLTDVNGQIPVQQLYQAVHSITGTSTVDTNTETPHKVRTLYIGDTDLDSPNGKYAVYADEFSKDLGGVASLNTIFLDIDPYVTHTKTQIAAYPGIAFTHGSQLLTMSSGHTILELYEACVNEGYDNPQYDTFEIMSTIDGNTIFVNYDLLITVSTLTGGGKTLSFNAGKDITFQTTADFSGTLSIDGNVNWGTATALSNLTVTGTFDFSAAGTYSLTNCVINEVTNSSGGAVTINAVNSTITTNTGPNITINQSVPILVTVIDDSTGSPLQYARVRLNKSSDKSLIMSEETDVNGEASTTFNYLSDTPIEGWVRQWDLSGDDYTPKDISGTITSAGFALTVRLEPITP